MSEPNYFQIAEKCIDVLLDRKGFDDWWENIDEVFQNEMLDEMAAIIEKRTNIKE